MLIRDLPMKIVTVVSVSWGFAIRIYVFPCGLVSYRYHKKLIKCEKTMGWGKMAMLRWKWM